MPAPNNNPLRRLKLDELADIKGGDAEVLLQMRALLESIFKEFKGPKGLAKRLFIEFEAANPGSSVRVKILDNIMRLLEKFESTGNATMEQVDDALVDEIEQELLRGEA